MVRRPKLCDRKTTVGELRTLFLDNHVHAALIIDDGVLISVVQRSDLDPLLPDTDTADQLGNLSHRAIRASEPLGPVKWQMISAGQRRLAVIDDMSRLVGLLCLKRNLTGFCSDHDVYARANDEQEVVELEVTAIASEAKPTFGGSVEPERISGRRIPVTK